MRFKIGHSGGVAWVNVPNLLTLLRFALIPIYIFLFSRGFMVFAFLTFLLAGATDVLDGYIARKRNQITELGKMLDPLADKLMMLTVVISLLIKGLVPWQAGVAIFIRDGFMILGGFIFHFRGKQTVAANALGKLTTVLFYLAILLVVVKAPFAIGILWIVIAVSVVGTAVYMIQLRAVNGGSLKP